MGCLVFNLGNRRVLLDRFDPVQRGRLALVGFAGRNHLPVAGHQVEVDLPLDPFLSTNLPAILRLLDESV